MSERWLPVVGFEGFVEVSDRGRLRSLDRVIVIPSNGRSDEHERTHKGRLLKQSRHPRGGYMYITLCGGRKVRRNIKVHHLVLETFVGPRPPGMEGCHGNDVGSDNRLVNLRWDTPEGNVRDRVISGRGRKTHCKRKHLFTPENTMILTNQPGSRRCRACARENGRKQSRRRRALARAERRSV